MHKRYLLFLLMLMCGCAGQRDFYGRYSSVPGWVGVSLDIKKDRTFTYSITDCTTHSIVDGTWQKRGRFAVLEGEDRPIPPNQSIVEESIKGSTDSLYVSITDLTGTDTPVNAAVTVWRDTTIVDGQLTNFDGVAVVKKSIGINIIKIVYILYTVPPYHIKNAQSNYFAIKADNKGLTPIEFKGKKVKFRRNKLSITNLTPPNKYHATLYKTK